jgi:hypothetical protein
MTTRTTTKNDRARWHRVRKERTTVGVYEYNDTRDELKMCLSIMEPTDYALTLIRRTGEFSVYNSAELSGQIHQWRGKAKLLDRNVFERTVDGKKIWMFVIQPKDDALLDGFCPLALALDVMVSGYAYITTKPIIVEIVKAALA